MQATKTEVMAIGTAPNRNRRNSIAAMKATNQAPRKLQRMTFGEFTGQNQLSAPTRAQAGTAFAI